MEKENDHIMHDVEEDDKAAIFQQIRLRKQLIICCECEQSFESVSRLESHVTQVHVGWLPFECPYCKTFKPSESEIRTHIRMRHRGYETKFMYSPDDRRRQRVNVLMQRSLSRVPPSANIIGSNSSLVIGAPAPDYEHPPSQMIPSADLDPYSRRSALLLPESRATAPPRTVYAQQNQQMEQQSTLQSPTESRMGFQRPSSPTVPLIILADESDDGGNGKRTSKRRTESASHVAADLSASELCAAIGNGEAGEKRVETSDKARQDDSDIAQSSANRKASLNDVVEKLKQSFAETDLGVQAKAGVCKDVITPTGQVEMELELELERESAVHLQPIALQNQTPSTPQNGQSSMQHPSDLQRNAQNAPQPASTAPSTILSSNDAKAPCAYCERLIGPDDFDAHVRSYHLKGPHSKCGHCDFASDEKKIVERHCSLAHVGLSRKVTPAPTAQQVKEKILRCFGAFAKNADALVMEANSTVRTAVEKKSKTKNSQRSPGTVVCNLCKREIRIKGGGRKTHVYDHLLNDSGISAYKCLKCGFGSVTVAIMTKHRKSCPGSRVKADKDSIQNEYERVFSICWNL
uniref:C2H2-type domain-containing protein n=2 Tax=Plectus sambesii TaxID=2011161 RepID=A0A914W825_9BILA